jgi:DNA repair exonuclease SbcCD ATPase subunit
MIRMQEENQARAARDTENLVKESKESVKKAQIRIKKTQAEIATLLEETKVHDELAEENDDLYDQIKELATLKNSLDVKVSRAQETIQFYQDNDHCPTCTQEITGDIKQDHITKKNAAIKELNTAIEKTLKKYKAAKTKREKITNNLVSITKKMGKINDLQSDVNQDMREIELHKNHIEQLKQKVDTETTDILIELRTKLSQSNSKLESVTKTRALYDIANTILKDTGIKARIVKQYVPVINMLVNKYLAAMDFFVKFELNENFEEKILSRHRDDFSYGSFSEGEKMRIDLALLFTWRTIARMKNSASTNLLILDEVFDASLDVNGCEEFLKLIHSLENANVFVISHKGDVLQDKFRSSIRFEKHNNFSRIAA